jgi:hypothetical protein
MWIFCCGMMRSGSTVQFQIAARLVEDAGLGKRVEWVSPEDFAVLRDKYATYREWKVFKTHICTKQMAEEFLRHNALGLYIFRDLRDVIVSILKKTNTPFDKIFVENYLNTCLNQYLKWTNLPGVMISKYEDLIADLPGEVKKIARLLKIYLSPGNCELIASDYTLEKQKERIEKYNYDLKGQNLTYKGQSFNPHTLLHVDHINSGSIDQWKQFLSMEQIKFIEIRAGKWLKSHGYTLMCSDLERSEEFISNERN